MTATDTDPTDPADVSNTTADTAADYPADERSAIPRGSIGDTAVVCTECEHTGPIDRTQSRDGRTRRHRCRACDATGTTVLGSRTAISYGTVRRVSIDPADGENYYHVVADDLLVDFSA